VISYQNLFLIFIDRKKQLRQLAKRDGDDEEFLDQIDYPPDVKVYERFMKYRAMKSFKTTEWDPYVISSIFWSRISPIGWFACRI